MGRKLGYDPGRAVEHYRTLLDNLAEPPRSLSQAPDSQLRVVLRKAGFHAAKSTVLRKLQSAFDAAGLITVPRLTEPGLTRKTRIYFFRPPGPQGVAPPRVLFKSEELLEEFLVENFEALELFDGLRLRSRQYSLAQGRRIDMLCEDRKTGQLVGVELKHESPDRGLPTQIRQYLSDLSKLAVKEGRTAGARALIITGQPDPEIAKDVEALCQAGGFEVSWRLYRVGISLEDPAEGSVR